MKEQFGLDDKMIRQYIEANKHNKFTAFYYLMAKKKKLEGEKIDEFNYRSREAS